MADAPVNLVFLHHSCGSNWLADRSDEKPHGGGLRRTLQQNGFCVHDTNYKDDVPGADDGLSPIGDHTDVCHWTRWFGGHLEGILRWQCEPGAVNEVVMFKTCYPGSNIAADGAEPGDPESPEKTLANYRAVYNRLAEIFAAQPETLFIPVTAPPLSAAGKSYVRENAARARVFNNWLKGPWLKAYREKTGLKNVAVFDFFNILAGAPDDANEPNGLRPDYRRDTDSHPTEAGNRAATAAFLPFIRTAVVAFRKG